MVNGGESPWREQDESGWVEVGTHPQSAGLVGYDRNDRMLIREEFEAVERACATRFTLDACCNGDGSNAHCPQYCSLSRSFLQLETLAGQHVWINPPFDNIEAFLSHYCLLKARSPHNTSACILVPAWKRPAWRRWLHGMSLIKQYSRGTKLFTAPNKEGSGRHALPGVPWDVEVWYDPPKPVLCAAAAMRHAITMQFKGAAQGLQAWVLCDTGCTDILVSAAFARRMGVRIVGRPHGSSESVELGDGQSSIRVLGVCSFALRIQGWTGHLKAFVVEPMLEQFDVVLGDAWMHAYGAVLDYRKRELVVRRGTRRVCLKPEPVMHVRGPGAAGGDITGPAGSSYEGDPMPTKLLSAMQMKRVVNRAAAQGTQLFTVQIRKVEEVEEDGEDPGVLDEDPGDPRQSTGLAGLRLPPDGTHAEPGLSDWAKVRELVSKHAVVFGPLGEPSKVALQPVMREVPGARPQARPLRRLSPRELEEVQKQVKDLLARGYIQPSESPYAAPILFALKKDGGLRFCIDYRWQNKQCVRNRTPLPRIDDLLDAVGGAKVFSSIDLASGYWQLRLHESDVEKTAFRTPMGLYEWRVLPMGLANAPAAFQTAMNNIFGDLITERRVLVYLDDILILGKDGEDHLRTLGEVLRRLEEHGLKAKAEKCELNVPELEFLGHRVGRDGIKPCDRKVAAVRDWPVPSSVTELRQFLGLANYFRRFLKGYAGRVACLTAMTGGGTKAKQVAWGPWTAECQEAFEWVKAALVAAPVLAPPDHSKPFQVTVDASDVGLGAVLMQEGRVVAYESRKLSPAEARYTVTEREMLAVVHALRVWRCHLEGGLRFEIRTDHKPNTFFDSKAELSRREARWLEFMAQFDYTWTYTPGKENVLADPLSRMPRSGKGGVLMVTLRPGTHVVGWCERVGVPRREVAASVASQGARPVPSSLALFAMQTRGARRRAEAETASVEAAAQVRTEVIQAHMGQGAPGAQPVVGMVAEPKPRRGKKAVGAEAPTAVGMHAAAHGQPVRNTNVMDSIKKAYAGDPWFADPANTGNLEFSGGFWWRRAHGGAEAVVVPDAPGLKDVILTELHDCPYSGHVGVHKLQARLRHLYWWPTWRQDCVHWVKTCVSCQQNKGDRRAKGLLQPLPPPQHAFEELTWDLITHLPKTKAGHDAIVVWVDRLSKMVHFAPTTTTVTAEGLAKLFLQHVWRLHGVPLRMVSDRDPRITSEYMRLVFKMLGTKQSFSTAFHPQTDGQTERYNRVLEDCLRHYVGPGQDDWDEYLAIAEFAINSSWQETVQSEPFRLVYGRMPHTPLSAQLAEARAKAMRPVPAARALVHEIQEGIARARQCMLDAQTRLKARVDKHRKDESFAVGDEVLLHTVNLSLKGTKKLLPRWIGPFKVTEVINSVAYRLGLPAALGKIHDVFHVSLLKRFLRDNGRQQRMPPPPPLMEDAEGAVYEVERILDHREVRSGSRVKMEYKVRWRGYTEEHDTWEPEKNLVAGVEQMLQAYWQGRERVAALPGPPPRGQQ